MMSMKADVFDKKSDLFIGKVRSNFLGTEFNIYDNGLNPRKIKGNSDHFN